jgi:hypothetical protein
MKFVKFVLEEDDSCKNENQILQGSNRVCLIQARKTLEKFGACEIVMKINVRKPRGMKSVKSGINAGNSHLAMCEFCE